MPSVQALSKMSAKALANLIEHANSIPVNGIGFVEADAAFDFKFEPTADLGALVSGLIAERGVTGALDALGSGSDAFKLVWDELDDNYTYYNTNVNDAFIDLGIAYADYLVAGGDQLSSVVKYAPDNGTDADSIPERLQTLHDNILGNFDELSIVDKFGAAAEDIFERITDAGYGDMLGELGNYADGRPIYGGYDHQDPAATIAFDQAFFG